MLKRSQKISSWGLSNQRRVGRRYEDPELSYNSRFVRGHHVLDVDEGVVPTMFLKNLQSGKHEVPHGSFLLLAIVDGIADVQRVVPEDVHDGQKLAVIGHQRLPYRLLRLHQLDQKLHN
jgi:hypothetical protein